MKKIVLIIASLFTTGVNAEMVKGSTISDSAKQDICASRSISRVKIDDFLIDNNYVKRIRSNNSDAVFVVVSDSNPQLVTCYTKSGTGRFEPAGYQNQSNKHIWQLIKPKNPLDINTIDGQRMVVKICKNEVLKNLNSQDVKKIITTTVNEVDRIGGVRYPIGSNVNGVKAIKYDVISDGSIILSSSSNGLDSDTKKYKCLLDPAFNIKSLEIKTP